MGRLSGKVALITGGARGQGTAEARLFVAEGAKVVIGDVLDADGELVAKELGDAAIYVHHDVTDADAWTEIVSAATDAFGRLDVLINNAGIFAWTPLLGTSTDDYMKVIRVNQLGTFLGMQAVAPALTTAGGGSIVNVSSIAGLRGGPMTMAYSASKWAVRGMTKVAAVELAAVGIRVNSVHPGIIDTPMLTEGLLFGNEAGKGDIAKRIPLQEVASAEQVANMALFLASDDSSHCTGAEFVVDGGITAGMGFTTPAG
ncbi:MAG: glucose 1-dehydrogenase [Acidimicrobiales bacterium]